MFDGSGCVCLHFEQRLSSQVRFNVLRVVCDAPALLLRRLLWCTLKVADFHQDFGELWTRSMACILAPGQRRDTVERCYVDSGMCQMLDICSICLRYLSPSKPRDVEAFCDAGRLPHRLKAHFPASSPYPSVQSIPAWTNPLLINRLEQHKSNNDKANLPPCDTLTYKGDHAYP
jgi:hypothetical protein